MDEIKKVEKKETKAVEEPKEKKEEWPPHIGIWKGADRSRSLKRIRINPGEELVIGIVPHPGFILNGVGIIGKQALPQGTWDMIIRSLSAQEENQDTFIKGGKERTRFLGRFKG